MKNTLINWAHHTHCEWWGCSECSHGCDKCYARELAKRWRNMQWGPGAPRIRTSITNRKQPYKWNKAAAALGQRHRVFSSSMSDIFDTEVPLQWLADLLHTIDETPHLDWLLLTKRANVIQKRLRESTK